jgi:hypothetical protein
MSVLSVSRSASHNFSKEPTSSITLIEGLGVEGDCHAGVTGESPRSLQAMILHAIFRHSYFETFFVEFGKIVGLKLNFCYFTVRSNP